MQGAVRTQIYLPKDLRNAIDRQRQLHGESLAEYLRTAARERLKREKKKKADLKKLAKEIVSSLDPKKSAWAGINVEKWQHELRKDEDEHRFAKKAR